jgi:hypothetical protein
LIRCLDDKCRLEEFVLGKYEGRIRLLELRAEEGYVRDGHLELDEKLSVDRIGCLLALYIAKVVRLTGSLDVGELHS